MKQHAFMISIVYVKNAAQLIQSQWFSYGENGQHNAERIHFALPLLQYIMLILSGRDPNAQLKGSSKTNFIG
jgi:hypothetical protein